MTLSDEEIKSQCIEAASKGLIVQKNLYRVKVENELNDEEVEKELLQINNRKTLEDYATRYREKYKELRGENFEGKMPLTAAHVKIDNANSQYSAHQFCFKDSHIDISTLKNFDAGMLLGCTLVGNPNKQVSVRSEIVTDCFFSCISGFAIFNVKEIDFLIKDCFFSNKNGQKLEIFSNLKAIKCRFNCDLMPYEVFSADSCMFNSLVMSHAKKNQESESKELESKELELIGSSFCRFFGLLALNGKFQRIDIENCRLNAIECSELESTSSRLRCIDIKMIYKEKPANLGAFRKLKKLCDDAEYEHGVILFHGLEQETHYHSHLKKIKFGAPDWPEKVASIFNKHFTDYGRDMMRPFKILFLLSCFCFFAFSILNPEAFFYVDEDNNYNFDVLVYSIRNALGPLIIALPEDIRKVEKFRINEPTMFIGFFQFAISSIIWFLIVFMIRRRFKIS